MSVRYWGNQKEPTPGRTTASGVQATGLIKYYSALILQCFAEKTNVYSFRNHCKLTEALPSCTRKAKRRVLGAKPGLMGRESLH